MESRAFEWAPLSVSRRRSRGLRKTPQWSAERRAGPRYGPAIPSADGRGLAVRQANGRGVPRPRISALRFPLLGVRRVRNRQFGTTVRRDAPRGNAPPRVNGYSEKNHDAEICAPDSPPSCPRLSRASTPFFVAKEGVDGRNKSGHDERWVLAKRTRGFRTLVLAERTRDIEQFQWGA